MKCYHDVYEGFVEFYVASLQHKTLRNLRKRNGNTSLYEQSGEAKNTTHIEDELLAQYQHSLEEAS